MSFYLTAFRIRLLFLLYIYKARLLKLSYKLKLHNVALEKRFIPKSDI
jgi:hypothetical protein